MFLPGKLTTYAIAAISLCLGFNHVNYLLAKPYLFSGLISPSSCLHATVTSRFVFVQTLVGNVPMIVG